LNKKDIPPKNSRESKKTKCNMFEFHFYEGGVSLGELSSTVVFCRLNIAPSRVFATELNPIVATIIPKMVPEIKLIISV
jgi:hypothetical protein